jgi:hypothetical protein
MSQFITDLDAREMTRDTSTDKRGTRKLLQPLVYSSDKLGRMVTVPAGFVTDYASVPRIPVAYLLAGGCADAAAVIHDWLYTTHEVDRATADAVFREAIVAGGDPAWRAWLMWAGVRIGGARPYEADGQKQLPYVAGVIDAVHPDGS